MMNGRTEGLRMLDLSADGFWTSFFGIVIALPALFLGWVSVANDIVAFDPEGAGRLSLILRLALVDLAAWLLPLVGLGTDRAPCRDRGSLRPLRGCEQLGDGHHRLDHAAAGIAASLPAG